jgi:hypothetical protein
MDGTIQVQKEAAALYLVAGENHARVLGRDAFRKKWYPHLNQCSINSVTSYIIFLSFAKNRVVTMPSAIFIPASRTKHILELPKKAM